MSTKKRGLGRGLSALLESAETDVTNRTGTADNSKVAGSVSLLKVGNIEANPFQPRLHFNEEALAELAESIRQHGIIQPITVRKMGYDKYQIISGERRFRASQLAGLDEVPCYIRVANDQSMLEMALVENVQRENLDAIEVALGYKRLIDECSLTQEQLAEKVGKKRATVTNYLRLLKLPVDIQVAIKEGVLSMGHARALINIDSEAKQLEIFEAIVADALSVRQTEELVRGAKPATPRTPKTAAKKAPAALPPNVELLREELSSRFDRSIAVKRNSKGKGSITIPFTSDADLEKLYELLNG